MKADENNIGQNYKVRLFHYTWFRHYGGREIKTFPCIVDAKLIGIQDDYQRYIIEVLSDYLHEGKVVYKAGRKIAVSEKDFMV